MATMVEEVGQSLNAREQAGGSKEERIPDPCIVVIFGASGDLTKKKLLPSLFHLEQQHLLPKEFVVVGVARRDLSGTFAGDMQDGILKSGGVDRGDSALKPFIDRVKYFATEFDNDEGFDKLKAFLADIDQQYGTKGNRLFYLAVAPEYFADIAERLAKHGMTQTKDKGQWINVIIEKPFGTDLQSARELNDELNKVLQENQIFRIDHYLGKETVQNILVFRFGNGIFEPVWNRNYIDNVQITAAESIGIEGRGPFYEKAGALRDIIQNHMMELLGFVTMEPPSSFEAEAVRREKVKVWQSIPQIPITNAVQSPVRHGDLRGREAGD
jgi:glucose-6-phosphate 1-dehydrogenase